MASQGFRDISKHTYPYLIYSLDQLISSLHLHRKQWEAVCQLRVLP